MNNKIDNLEKHEQKHYKFTQWNANSMKLTIRE